MPSTRKPTSKPAPAISANSSSATTSISSKPSPPTTPDRSASSNTTESRPTTKPKPAYPASSATSTKRNSPPNPPLRSPQKRIPPPSPPLQPTPGQSPRSPWRKTESSRRHSLLPLSAPNPCANQKPPRYLSLLLRHPERSTTPTKWTSCAVEGSLPPAHRRPYMGFPPSVRVGRTLLSVAFDVASDLDLSS